MRAVADEIKGSTSSSRPWRRNSGRSSCRSPTSRTLPSPGQTPRQRACGQHGEPPVIDFPAKPHWELIEKLQIIDFPRDKDHRRRLPGLRREGSHAGTRTDQLFPRRGRGGRARELMPPLMVNAASATGTGQLPDKEDQMYVVGATISISCRPRRSRSPTFCATRSSAKISCP
jgi:hypothetical protein